MNITLNLIYNLICNITHLFRICIESIYSKSCIVCKKETNLAFGFCATCFQDVEIITEPYCKQCAEPFVLSFYNEFECQCKELDLHFSQARCLYAYKGVIKELIKKFKFKNKPELARFFSIAIYNMLKNYIQEAQVIAPVPMHIEQLKKRTYNQAALLTKALAQLSGQPMILDLIIQPDPKSWQHFKSKQERIQQIDGIFCINEIYIPLIHNKTILIVDDIITTGATASECAKVLGPYCKQINVLGIAKSTL